MLQFVRKKSFVYAIIGFVILAFVALIYFEWGMGGRSGTANEVARVNGRSIYIQDVKPIYEQLKERYKDQLTEENTDKMEKRIMTESIQMLVQKYILLQQAKKAKVGVSENEITRSISRIKDFQTEDGKFNLGLYQRLPAFYKKKLESDTKEDLTTQLFQMRLLDLVRTSELDLRAFFQEKYTKCKVQFVMVEVEKKTQTEMDALLNVDQERIKAEKIIDQFVRITKRTRNFRGAAAALRLKVKTTDYFSFFHPINEIGTNERYNEIEVQDIYVKAFELKPGQISDKITLNKGFVVLKVIARKNPNWDKFYKELPTLRMEYQAKIQRYVRNEWFMNIIQKAKIYNYLDKFYGQE